MNGTARARIHNLLATLNQEQEREKHDINGLYEGRLRSHAQNFEGMKRKWESITGMPLPKRLRTLEPDIPAEKKYAIPNQHQHPILNKVEQSKKPAATVAKTVKKQKATAPKVKVASIIVAAASAALPSVAVPTLAVMPPHPDDKININSMIVNDLRKELRKRQQSTSGRKAELQARLRAYLAEAKQHREAQWNSKYAATAIAKEEGDVEPRARQVKICNTTTGKTASKDDDAKESDVEMEDANDSDVSMDKVQGTIEPSAKKSVVTKPPTNNDCASVMKKQAPKSALKPSKYSAAVQSTPQFNGTSKLASVKPVPSSNLAEGSLAPKRLIPHKVSDTPTESSHTSAIATSAAVPKSSTVQMSVQKTKISSTLAQTTPIGSAYKSKVGGAGSAKLLAKKSAHSAASEARKARLAEMRQKAKPTAASASSATKPPSSQSKYALKKMASASKLGDNKPNSILAKMREKAAALQNAENAAPASNPIAAANHGSMTSSSTTVKRVSQTVPASQPATKSSPRALKSILDPANRLQAVAEPIKPKSALPVVEKALSPMQTYEMSDREEDSDSESDSDEEEYERSKTKKSIPEWAVKANLHRALERQFADGPDRQDPDKIFGEVITCNLEEIFDKKKSRYQRRTSSGNWTKDHVTLAEKLTYKRTMGYDKN